MAMAEAGEKAGKPGHDQPIFQRNRYFVTYCDIGRANIKLTYGLLETNHQMGHFASNGAFLPIRYSRFLKGIEVDQNSQKLNRSVHKIHPNAA